MKAASHTPIRNLHCSMVTTLPYSDEHFTHTHTQRSPFKSKSFHSIYNNSNWND